MQKWIFSRFVENGRFCFNNLDFRIQNILGWKWSRLQKNEPWIFVLQLLFISQSFSDIEEDKSTFIDFIASCLVAKHIWKVVCVHGNNMYPRKRTFFSFSYRDGTFYKKSLNSIILRETLSGWFLSRMLLKTLSW